MVLVVYVVAALLCLTPLIGPGSALALGLALSLGLELKLPARLLPWGKYGLQVAIVLMGFSMDPGAVWRAGKDGFLLTLVSLVFTLAVGLWLARRFKVAHTIGVLIAVGTAICGGSAIAAVAPTLKAKHHDVAVALAIVFLLNAIALFVFPPIGHLLHLSPDAFGMFAAIAVHDTSSVVGAAARFSEASVPIAVTIKLTRALWIVPLTLAAPYVFGGDDKKFTMPPVFLFLFLAAVGLRGLVPELGDIYATLGLAGRAILTMAIFLMGAQMTRAALRLAGTRALGLGVTLWLVVILAAFGSVSALGGKNFKETQLGYPRVRHAFETKESAARELFRQAGIPYPPERVFLRAFKNEKALELWAAKGTEYVLVKKYDVCASSGSLGPKRRAGDAQVPEGFYEITGFNPSSQYHLSVRVNYPNESDRILGQSGNLGGDIFIHGDCVTIGCLPLTDSGIEELYVILVDKKAKDASPIPVHLFPARLDDRGMKILKEAHGSNKELVSFWEDLKVGFDSFDKNHRLPLVRVEKKTGRYRFGHGALD